MAWILNQFYSAALTECNSMSVVVPIETCHKETYPVLWLLPPAGRDHTAWYRHADVDELAEKFGIIVAMPDLKLSYGADMVHGFAYFQMLTEELPDLVKNYFPADLEKQMIAGVMEGGYSAFYAALSCPGKYCFAACYSCGSLSDEAFEGRERKQMEDAFGEAGAFDLKALLSDEKRDHGKLKLSLVYAAGDRYKKSGLKELSRFAVGLEKDLDAVENSVASPLSNGFVEGTNSKLKMVKRTMYGRCNKDLLAAKLMYRGC